jgi:hypothetical protein
LKRFEKTDWDPTKAHYRTLGLIDGEPHMARDIDENFSVNGMSGNPTDGFTINLDYSLSKSYPVLGAVISFAPSSDENATYDATADVSFSDGEKDVKNAYTLSWAQPSEALTTATSKDGYVNLFQKFDQSHNSDKVSFVLKAGANTWGRIWGFSLVVEA